ncbi:MAG TPA: HlyD family secretion protein [Candidatus Acidoferrales bacterium]|jgi:membrane fusion protein (multidrug efflux system)|nr:HlyD family secretion protein [Candidatus Acidoferrales bacterium]
MNTTTDETRKERSLNSTDRDDTLTTPPPAGNHHAQPAVPKRDGEGKANPPADPDRSKSRLRVALLVVALITVVGGSAYYFRFIAPFESTDDAFIEAHVIPVAPQVAGRVAQLFVRDNQEVKPGDLLVQIGPDDYQAKLDQERAGLAAVRSRFDQANAQFTVDQAKVEQEKANVAVAKAMAKQAEADNKRYQAAGDFAVSKSQLDLAATQARSAEAQVDAVRNQELAAEAQAGLDKAGIQTAAAEIQNREANVRQAGLNLSYTGVKAPEAGYVTHRTVETGAYVQTGQALLAIVPRQVWVVANFKETQLSHMQAGQPVEVKVDAYPHKIFHGHVDSIQHGSGPSFSLLPPENASGNFVKVVQRVPVKIVLDDTAAANYVLGPGMSVEPEVRVK